MEHKVPVAYFNTLTPHRGTRLNDTMKVEGRILDDHPMGRWAGLYCYIRPAYCTPEEVEEYVRNIYKEFYSLPSMVKRLPMPVAKAHIASWVVNTPKRKVSCAGAGMEDFEDY